MQRLIIVKRVIDWWSRICDLTRTTQRLSDEQTFTCYMFLVVVFRDTVASYVCQESRTTLNRVG